MEVLFVRSSEHPILEPLTPGGDVALKFIATSTKLIIGDVRNHWKLALIGLGITPDQAMTTPLARHLSVVHEVMYAGDVHRDGRITFSVDGVYAELGLIPKGDRAEIEAGLMAMMTGFEGIPTLAPELT